MQLKVNFKFVINKLVSEFRSEFRKGFYFTEIKKREHTLAKIEFVSLK